MGVRITCINKDGGNHENPYVAISHLGWQNPDTGVTGRSTRTEMYDYVELKGGYAYVDRGGIKTKVVGRVSPRGNKYVKTEANSIDSDNLLNLLECR